MPRRLRYCTSRSRHALHDAEQLLGLHDKLPVIFGHVITEMLLQQVDGLAIELEHEDVFVYYFFAKQCCTGPTALYLRQRL